MQPQELLGGMVRAITSGTGWRAWTPHEPPWPVVHPLGGECRHGNLSLRLPAPGMALEPNGVVRLVRLKQEMCLAHEDFISDHIVRHGAWRDCGMFVQLWLGLDGKHVPMFKGKPPLPQAGDPEGVLLEVGANIGACSVELLMRTRASIIAFEPSRVNLYHLTRSLRQFAARVPEVADRVVVFPVGVGHGSRGSRSQMFVPRGNLGNSMFEEPTPKVTMPKVIAEELKGAVKLEAIVLPLSTIFPSGLGKVRLLKIDTQGYECHVLHGALATLRHKRSRVEIIVTEIARSHLMAQCCKPAWVTHLLRGIGVASVNASTGWTPSSNAVGLYGKQLPRTGPPDGYAWNVSCDGQGEFAEERTCLARPWRAHGQAGHSRAQLLEPTPYQLRFERYDRPQLRWTLRAVKRAMHLCKQGRLH
jgi:FkbM family methyltransferase